MRYRVVDDGIDAHTVADYARRRVQLSELNMPGREQLDKVRRMLSRIWNALRGPAHAGEIRADEEVVRRELEATAPAPELEKLATARGSALVRVHGAFLEADYFELPGRLFPALEMIGITLEFDGQPPLYLRGRGDGEGLQMAAAGDIYWDDVVGRDLNAVEPFARVLGSRLRELSLLSTRGNPRHMGVRLQFESGELVFVNDADQIETYDRLGPQVLQRKLEPAVAHDQLYEYSFVTKK